MSEVVLKINRDQVNLLITSLAMKIKSIERAANNNKSPLFTAAYEAELLNYYVLKSLVHELEA